LNYSDWLLDSKDESYPYFAKNSKQFFRFDNIYFHKENDAPALKRKFVIGDSYLFQQEKLVDYYKYGYYATDGYRQVGFRYVIKKTDKSDSIITDVLEYWGLKVK
jgi:hypothetical protein